MRNKKAQFESKLLAIIIIVIIGIILLFFNRLNNELYSGLDEWLNDTAASGTNYSEAREALEGIQTVENSIWDYAFLAIFIGLILQIILFSFATRINIAFFWIMLILDIPILVVGVVLSNIWQEIASNPEFTTTIARFPITNSLLGTYFPIAVVFLIFVTSIILFGKRPSVQIQ
jgi:hypothetical protein